MIRSTLVVIALYVICCGMAFGQSAPPSGPEVNPPAQAPRLAVRGPGSGQGAGTPEPSVNSLMQRSGGSLLAATYATAGQGPAGNAGEVKKPPTLSLFAVTPQQPRTFKKHDLITIMVHEESQATSTGNTALTKAADIDSKVDAYVKMNLAKFQLGGTAAPTVTPELKMENSRDFTGTASVDRADAATARVTGEVIDVKPNGTLVVQARSHIKLDDEEVEFMLTGVCRAEDINPDNTVLSTQCFDLQFQKNSKGAITDTNKRGLFSKILDAVNPF